MRIVLVLYKIFLFGIFLPEALGGEETDHDNKFEREEKCQKYWY